MTLITKTKQYLTGTYNLLLTFLVLLFIFRPFDYADYYPGIWKIILTSALLLAIFDCHHSKSVKIAACLLAVPALVFSWLVMFYQTKFVELGLALFSSLFLLVCTASIIYDVLLRAKVTVETLRGVVCAYFLVAFLFAYLYTVIEFFLPGSFIINGQVVTTITEINFFCEMLYFSFVTLLTIGYGDIVALRDIAQTTAVIQGIIGQFYIAILVARIVSVYSFYSDKRLIHEIEKNISKKH